MELGVSTMIFGHDDPIEYLHVMAEEGIFNVEIRGYLPRINYHNTNYLKRLKDELQKCGIKVHSFHLPFYPDDGFDISRWTNSIVTQHAIDEIKLSIEAMIYLGGKIAVLHPGDEIGSKDGKDERYKNSQKNIETLLQYCEKNKVKLAVENMLPGKVGEKVADALGIISGFDSEYIGVCLDTSHANITSHDVPGEVRKCVGKLFTIHVSDNNGKEDQHYLPFDGKINWPSFWKELNGIKYEDVFMMEVTRHLKDSRLMLKEAKKRFEKIISG